PLDEDGGRDRRRRDRLRLVGVSLHSTSFSVSQASRPAGESSSAAASVSGRVAWTWPYAPSVRWVAAMPSKKALASGSVSCARSSIVGKCACVAHDARDEVADVRGDVLAVGEVPV